MDGRTDGRTDDSFILIKQKNYLKLNVSLIEKTKLTLKSFANTVALKLFKMVLHSVFKPFFFTNDE